jgi:hypothetical protein
MNPSKNTLSLVRTNFGTQQTEGELFVLDENAQVLFQCFTLELPWLNNLPQKSCIPAGRYKIVPRFSAKYKNHLHILDVPNRSWILIHEANYVHQLLGCIAVGKARRHLNGDGLRDITDSIITKQRILEYITGPTQIIIS